MFHLGLVPNLRLIWDRSGNSGTGPIAMGTGPPPLYSAAKKTVFGERALPGQSL